MRGVLAVAVGVALGFWGSSAIAVTVTGEGWALHYNLPDADTTLETSRRTDEFAIRTVLLQRLRALKRGDEALLATFTFSGGTDCCGAAGPIIKAMASALDRGASVGLVVGNGVPLDAVFGGRSLAGLAARRINPLRLARDRASEKLMHHKLAVLRYGRIDRRVMVASWNFTGGASSLQWNVALELHQTGAYEAYRHEMLELLAGRFHGNRAKSRAHDGTTFEMPGAWGPCVARFGPFATPAQGAALEDVLAAIAAARHEICVAVPRLTLPQIAAALIAAADRGVRIRVLLPKSDTGIAGESRAVVNRLRRRGAYRTRNRVELVHALRAAEGERRDGGLADLVHVKYMVVDPGSERPWVVHGSANWTYSALKDPEGNDENVLVMRHAGVAQAFYGHFLRMTGFKPVSDAGNNGRN